MPTSNQYFGKLSEIFAKKYLETQGYCIVECNRRTPYGEIDLIAKDQDTIVFVEVKARRSNKFGHPNYAVHAKKQHKIISSALFYLQQTQQSHLKARFDVLSIQFKNQKIEAELIKNAFQEFNLF